MMSRRQLGRHQEQILLLTQTISLLLMNRLRIRLKIRVLLRLIPVPRVDLIGIVDRSPHPGQEVPVDPELRLLLRPLHQDVIRHLPQHRPAHELGLREPHPALHLVRDLLRITPTDGTQAEHRRSQLSLPLQLLDDHGLVPWNQIAVGRPDHRHPPISPSRLIVLVEDRLPFSITPTLRQTLELPSPSPRPAPPPRTTPPTGPTNPLAQELEDSRTCSS